MATSRRAAIGATRLARSAGATAEATVTTTPTTTEVMIVAAVMTVGPDGMSRPTLASSSRRPNDIPIPRPSPAAQATSPTATASSEHRTQDLAASGTDGTQHGEVAGALGDHDRERVVDDEHPDEQRDVGEGEEERVEELQVLAEVGLLVGGVGLAGEHLDLIVGERRLQANSELVGGDVGGLGDHDAVEVARLTEQLLGGAEVGGDHRRAGDPLDLAEHRLTDERELDRSGLGQDGERVADRPALVGHGGAVDDRLVGRLGRAPLGELERVEPRVVDPRRSDRRSQLVVGDRTVVTDELGEALDRAGRGVDSVDLQHVGERRLVDSLANLGHVAVDRRSRGGRWRRRLRCWWRARRRTCAPWCR